MIQSIDIIENKVTSNCLMSRELELDPNDILVIKFNQDLWNLEQAQTFLNNYRKVFHNNTVVATFNGIDFEVIKQNG